MDFSNKNVPVLFPSLPCSFRSTSYSHNIKLSHETVAQISVFIWNKYKVIQIYLFSSPLLMGFFDFLVFFELSTSNITYCLLQVANSQLNGCIPLIIYTQVYFVSACQAVCLNGCDATNDFKLMHTMHMNQNTELNPKDCGEAAGQFSLDFAFHYKPDSDSHPKSSQNILCASNFSCLAIWEYLLQTTRNTYQIPGNFEKMPKEAV